MQPDKPQEPRKKFKVSKSEAFFWFQRGASLGVLNRTLSPKKKLREFNSIWDKVAESGT